MRTYRNLSEVPAAEAGRFVTVGTFDGVHRGHQALLRHLCYRARQLGSAACVVTFDPHPQLVLRHRPFPGLLNTLSEKLSHLEGLGVDEVLVLPFTAEFARTEPEVFIRQWLVGPLGLRGILVGHDHMFGRGRRGDTRLLQQLGAELGFFVEEFPALKLGDTVVSSSLIRRLLQEGAVEAAAELLGYPYSVCGTVIHGDGRGRRLGFPTANILPEDPHKLLPDYGVYIVTTHVAGTPYAGLASYGVRPTIGQGLAPQLEVYLLDFSGRLYNERLCLSFWKRVREERHFLDLDSLRQQMDADERLCRSWIAEHRILEIRVTTSSVSPHADQRTQG